MQKLTVKEMKKEEKDLEWVKTLPKKVLKRKLGRRQRFIQEIPDDYDTDSDDNVDWKYRYRE